MSARPATSRTMLALIVVLCGVTLFLGYLNKARCTGPPFEPNGRSLIFDEIKDSQVCYSDIQFLWLGRDINNHVFPYVDGGITRDGALTGGSVEYPVLTGTLMWIGAIPAHNDAEFLLYSALLLAPFALLTAWMLGWMAGRAAFLWSIGPPLVMYAFHNWELPVVFTAVAAVFVMTRFSALTLRKRGVLAAVLLGIGFCLKLYPGVFVLPLLLYVLTGGPGGAELPRNHKGRYDVRGAGFIAIAAAATVAAINLPFAILGYNGWRASFAFQQQREADITTNSIWYWGLRSLFGTDPGADQSFQHAVSVISPTLVLASFALAVWLGWRRYQVTGTYPWIAVSAAMLCGFLLFHKVHSPQYTLWLLPFFVLLAVPWGAVFAYLAADIAVGVGVFLYFNALTTNEMVGVTEHLVQFGVWGRALLLALFFVLFLRAPLRFADSRGERLPAEPDRDLVGAAQQ
ncbi:DUF2029 domain-containing protein [Skermania sp. ID1734]|uniref:glycosyltransferase family 87 protein n=1 Tax=Skermania sp. ID1734 TaxID=2597516 RepID=UPI00117BE82D|nr:glycosyltransferase 87 family protein [Skermania sp. ID1734]TSE00451.1 DUF2029 domain-containing protein [Skermania sp. ID1734]